MNNSYHTGSPSLGRRLILAAIIALALVGIGYMVYQSGFIAKIYQAMGGEVSRPTQAAPYSREQMEQDRKQYKDSASELPAQMPVGADGYYIPPSERDIPDTPYGESVKRGRAIFTNTGGEVSREFVGNSMACVNCHLDAGRRENSAPMWGAYGAYPAYRAKTHAISTLEDRIIGCFTYSMNAQASEQGKAPAAGHDIYRDLMTYMAWMSDGAPNGASLRGALYVKLKETEQGYDVARGKKVYEHNCQLCHGAQGQGMHEANGKVKFPPLWGPESYNWGAGMARIDTAAGFIKANMPLAKPYSLTDQEAWDVAAYINSHERPKDPRQTGTVAEAAEKEHKGEKSYYGKEVNGQLLGVGVSRAN